jgi:hypothetical protein
MPLHIGLREMGNVLFEQRWPPLVRAWRCLAVTLLALAVTLLSALAQRKNELGCGALSMRAAFPPPLAGEGQGRGRPSAGVCGAPSRDYSTYDMFGAIRPEMVAAAFAQPYGRALAAQFATALTASADKRCLKTKGIALAWLRDRARGMLLERGARATSPG